MCGNAAPVMGEVLCVSSHLVRARVRVQVGVGVGVGVGVRVSVVREQPPLDGHAQP